MKKLFTFLALLLLCGCSSLIGNNSIPGVLKERTYNYRNIPGLNHEAAREVMAKHYSWLQSTVAVQSGGKSGKGFASGVCIGIEDGYSWVATAHHVVKKGVRFVRYTWLDDEGKTVYRQFEVVETYHHPKSLFSGKDFSLLKVKGELPYWTAPIAERPAGGFDITVGYQGMGIDNKAVYEGRAEKGQSGGGVYHSTGGLYGIVSTHTQGVGIVECLREMNMEYIIGDKR